MKLTVKDLRKLLLKFPEGAIIVGYDTVDHENYPCYGAVLCADGSVELCFSGGEGSPTDTEELNEESSEDDLVTGEDPDWNQELFEQEMELPEDDCQA